MRRIAFCFDGSWNGLQADKKPTNVQLLAEAIKPVDADDGTVQIVYYDEGVGTQSDEVLRGGAFGKGLLENLREAYRFLIFNYEPGDELFIFGFSRGGFTAMAFAGLIRSIAILPTSAANEIDRGFEIYQRVAKSEGVDCEELRDFRARNCPNFCVSNDEIVWRLANIPGYEGESSPITIRYLGVWDAVGSLGLRVIKALVGDQTEQVYQRYLTDLDKIVSSARHALSIDERRKVFKPTLWDNLDKLNERGPDNEEYEDERFFQQKWFPGDHGSVGGGGQFDGLSRGALQWIVEGAAKQQLAIDVRGRSQLSKLKYDISTSLCNSHLSGFGRFKSALKAVFLSADRGKPRDVNELSYPAVRMMLAKKDELHQGRLYRPQNLAHLQQAVERMRSRFEPQGIDDPESWEEYEVAENDTLSKIAKARLGDSGRYREIFDANRDRLDTVNAISPGEHIRVPKQT